MDFFKKLYEQFKVLLPTLVFLYLPIVVLLGLTAFGTTITHKPLWYFFRDIFIITGAPLYTGFISNIGAIIWSFATAVCFFCFFAIRRFRGEKKLQTFFLFSGLITTMLLFDDFFMLHEAVYPRILHLDSEIIYGGYILIIILYLIEYRAIILESEFLILLLAFGFFGLSIAFDELRDTYTMSENLILVEDGFKFFGIATWLLYHTRTGIKILKDTAQQTIHTLKSN